MAEYIKREDVLEFSRIFVDQVWETGGYRNCTTIAVPAEKIEEIPSADVAEVKHGKWIEQEDGFGDAYYDCSCCGESFCLIDGTPTDNMYNFCPNCGARMVEHDIQQI